MAGTLTELAVAGRLAARAIGRRLRSQVQPAPDVAEFVSAMNQLLESAPAGLLRDYSWLTMSASQAPWVAADTSLSADEEVSYFIDGRVYANKFLDIWIDPAANVWSKIGEQGEIFRGTRRSHSFRSDSAGPLYFGNYFPNDWADPQGTRKQSDDIYAKVSGELCILMLRWNGTAAEGLRTLRSLGDYQGLVQGEIERLEQGDVTPRGWHYLWHLGPAEIYRQQQTSAGHDCIHCCTQGDVGILQKNVDLALTETTEISWRWCVDQLPSDLREDAIPSHDYLSLAVEFDNGRDITYYWSSTLPVGTGYDCPLPNWKGKEYHVVVRSGKTGLGDWQDERRNLYTDYRQYMGDPPRRIVRVWLIANSIFQRNSGICDYSDILLYSESDEQRVL